MISSMRQQEFSAMQAEEANLARQQGQLQMEMQQMQRQMEQLGQTAQREEAILFQQTQIKQLPMQQAMSPGGPSLLQNTIMSPQQLLPPQPQLQQWAPLLQGAVPPAMQ